MRGLDVGACRLHDKGFKQLMQAKGMHALQVLNARVNGLHLASLKALAGALQAGCLPQLA